MFLTALILPVSEWADCPFSLLLTVSLVRQIEPVGKTSVGTIFAMDELALIYATFPDLTTARSIGEGLVRAQLAACINVLPGVTSIYRWDGQIEEAQEVAALIKTRRSVWDAVRSFIKDAHPYETPVIILVDIGAVDADAKRWLMESVRAS